MREGQGEERVGFFVLHEIDAVGSKKRILSQLRVDSEKCYQLFFFCDYVLATIS